VGRFWQNSLKLFYSVGEVGRFWQNSLKLFYSVGEVGRFLPNLWWDDFFSIFVLASIGDRFLTYFKISNTFDYNLKYTWLQYPIFFYTTFFSGYESLRSWRVDRRLSSNAMAFELACSGPPGGGAALTGQRWK
jgi:hypothetical protein